MNRPNIVLVMVEQFGNNVCPGFGNESMTGEGIRNLMKESVIFENAYCASPVCGPSRFAFLTGNYVFNTNAYDNGSTIPSYMPTYAHMLTAAGYETVMCGRMHIHGLDQNHGFEKRPISEIIDPKLETKADLPGPMLSIDEIPPQREFEMECTVSESPIYKHDDCVTEETCRYLKEYVEGAKDKPFMITSGYLSPHPGSKGTPAFKELYEMYKKLDFTTNSFSKDEYLNLPEHAKRRLQYFVAYDQKFGGADIYNAELQNHEMALYLARCTYMDQQIEEIVNTLKETGLEKDTVFILTSDHGDCAGAHGLWGKMTFYEEAMKVPVIIRMPEGKDGGRKVSEKISLVDILPTLADLAGAEVSFPVDGTSFAPELNEDTKPSRDKDHNVFAEYHGYLSPAGMYMLVKGDYKYCHYLKEETELYNLKDDPGELKNLAGDDKYSSIVQDMKAELDSIVDMERVEIEVARYNQRRGAVFAGLASSEIIQQDTEKFITYFRETRNEKWWDGGEYMALEKEKERLKDEKSK
ncbi:MAG: sulfatase-like hydrolase/transferase [Planctomycetota bacterium]|jgi:choline-sulfatase